ncbi:ferredoxin reductase-like protein [Lasiosphaeria ovina]|uniref:Ferredoxin reductase-like protein n=1 Tax=Lasiosphaeria ovina TaxID=92902 RepID=A0AAE0MYL4_9PEZI|nr:ferredoxin reductase-like protein [Lasiosphaeria ovina]
MPPSGPFPPFLRAKLTASSMSGTQVAVAAAVAGVGAYALYLRNLASFGFHSLRLHSTELVSHNVKRLRFELPNSTQPSGLSLTSALLTISIPADETGFVELMVKHYPGGKQSSHLHSLKPATDSPHPQNPEDKTRITLVWGFGALQKKFPDRFKAISCVATPESSSPHPKGFITKQILEDAGLSASSAEKNKDIKVLVCGPPPMEKALKGAKSKPGVLTELGYSPAQIYSF